jgi:hypothetical protein
VCRIAYTFTIRQPAHHVTRCARLFGGYRFCASQVVAFGFAVARVVATLGEKTDKATLSNQSPVVRFGISSGFAFARPVRRF